MILDKDQGYQYEISHMCNINTQHKNTEKYGL